MTAPRLALAYAIDLNTAHRQQRIDLIRGWGFGRNRSAGGDA